MSSRTQHMPVEGAKSLFISPSSDSQLSLAVVTLFLYKSVLLFSAAAAKLSSVNSLGFGHFTASPGKQE